MESATLTINLQAIQKNWQQLSNYSTAECAAVVKANAYGLGAKEITKTLYQAGCRTFFVAYIEEAINIKPYAKNAEIFILNGISREQINLCQTHQFTTVINTLKNLDDIHKYNKTIKIALHVNTGMNRLGLPIKEIQQASDLIKKNPRITLKLLMSHLACADDRENSYNEIQRKTFQKIKEFFPHIPCSLSNSSAIFLGEKYHFDMLRPGYALYGGNPTPSHKNPMHEVVTIQSDILQIQSITKGDFVGYAASWKAPRNSIIATIPYGYADGFSRLYSNNGHAYIGEYIVPVIGRVSMDTTIFDVTDVPPSILLKTPVTLLGGALPLDGSALQRKTIGYEILISLGARLRKQYIK